MLHTLIILNSRPHQATHQTLRYTRPDAKVQVGSVRTPQQASIGGFLDVGDLRAHEGQLDGEKTCQASPEAGVPVVACHGGEGCCAWGKLAWWAMEMWPGSGAAAAALLGGDWLELLGFSSHAGV